MAIPTLLQTIRSMTGASATDASDDTIVAELARNRMHHVDAPLEWVPQIGAGGTLVYKRAQIPVWGAIEPDTHAATTCAILNGLGNAPSGNWVTSEDGAVVFVSDQAAAGSLYATVYSYDLNLTAAAILDQMAAAWAVKYNFADGAGQRFERSQAAAALTSKADVLRRRALPVVAHRVRRDEAVARRGPRSRGGNDL